MKKRKKASKKEGKQPGTKERERRKRRIREPLISSIKRRGAAIRRDTRTDESLKTPQTP